MISTRLCHALCLRMTRHLDGFFLRFLPHTYTHTHTHTHTFTNTRARFNVTTRSDITSYIQQESVARVTFNDTLKIAAQLAALTDNTTTVLTLVGCDHDSCHDFECIILSLLFNRLLLPWLSVVQSLSCSVGCPGLNVSIVPSYPSHLSFRSVVPAHVVWSNSS